MPIDDENSWNWTLLANPDMDFTAEEHEAFGGRNGMAGPLDEHYRPLLNRDSDYRIDREVQRTQRHSGIAGVPTQDAAVYKVRAAEIMLPESVPVLLGTAGLLRGNAPEAAG